MKVLEGLEPASVFGYFEEICNIPHTSYHEKELSDYCVRFAKARGLDVRQDEMGNVIMIKEGTKGYEEAEPIMLQGHLDMVGDKIADCPIDMEKDPIKLLVEGDFITADGTTLGGDDGIAVAYGLALLDAKEIAHPRLEVVFTVSEEVGLEGAAGIDLSCCRAKRMINIDSEAEGAFTCGCAGGVRCDCHIPVESEKREGAVYRILVRGLLGGHSGSEIHRGRGNANVLLGRFLLGLGGKVSLSMTGMKGGAKDNAIPKSAAACVVLSEEEAGALRKAAVEFQRILRIEYGATDPGIEVCVEQLSEKEERQVLTEGSYQKAVVALNLMPGGVQAMSRELPGLVETSLNMGVVSIDEKEIYLSFSLRSSIDSAKEFLGEKLACLTESLQGTVSFHGDYPGWPYERESALRELLVRVYEKQYGKKPVIDVIHAGLECGILSSKVEGLDCISLGPDMEGVHTPEERISISSVARVWEFLKAVLAEK